MWTNQSDRPIVRYIHSNFAKPFVLSKENMQTLEPIRKIFSWIAVVAVLFFVVNLFVWDSETVLPYGTVRTMLLIGFIAGALAAVLCIVEPPVSWKTIVFTLTLAIVTGGLYFFESSFNDAWKTKNEALKK